MAFLSSTITTPTTKGKVVITSAPNEYHEIGAWMISDLLEVAGWEVKYLGANTPQEDLLSCVRAFSPDILAISVTLPFNLDKAANIIEAMKNDPAFKETRVMLGGLGVRGAGNLWKTMQADGTAGNVKEAVELANHWYQEKIAS